MSQNSPVAWQSLFAVQDFHVGIALACMNKKPKKQRMKVE